MRRLVNHLLRRWRHWRTWAGSNARPYMLTDAGMRVTEGWEGRVSER